MNGLMSPLSKSARGLCALFSLVLLTVALSGSTCGTSTGGTGGTTFIGGGNVNNNGTGNGTVNGGTKPALNANDHILGDPNAKVTVIEYAQFDCPFCIQFARNDFPTIKANYIDTGKVRWVFRHFTFLPRAKPAARATECAADQTDFFTYADQLWLVADPNDETNSPTDADLKQLAGTLGLTQATFDSCYASTSKDARVKQDYDSAVALGLTSTPTFIIDSERFPRDANDTRPRNPTLTQIIDAHLAQ